MGEAAQVSGARWELYRLLAEPVRLRLLALAAEEELTIGELAELLREGQPNVSRHVAPLRKAGLLAVRKQGTRVLVRLSDEAARDAVVADGLGAGRELCLQDGSLARVHDLVDSRDASVRAFFGAAHEPRDPGELPHELPAYLSALAPLMGRRGLAVDVGTGEGASLDLLAPLFEHVIAVDREEVQLARAERRLSLRGYRNVTLLCETYDSVGLQTAVQARGGADLVFASRVLHHAPKPAAAVASLSRLLHANGALVVIDYAPHDDEALRAEQADLWLGFEAEELSALAHRAGLSDVAVHPIPVSLCGKGPDSGVHWQFMVARRRSDPTSALGRGRAHTERKK
jgi:ArsR family transcriptional regulator